jgi:hypothetical protein
VNKNRNHWEVKTRQLESENLRKKDGSFDTSDNPLGMVATPSGIRIIYSSKEFWGCPSWSSVFEE